MDKRQTVLKIADAIEEWGDDNDIAMSPMDMIELAERIYNLLPQIRRTTTALDAAEPPDDYPGWNTYIRYQARAHGQ